MGRVVALYEGEGAQREGRNQKKNQNQNTPVSPLFLQFRLNFVAMLPMIHTLASFLLPVLLAVTPRGTMEGSSAPMTSYEKAKASVDKVG